MTTVKAQIGIPQQRRRLVGRSLWLFFAFFAELGTRGHELGLSHELRPGPLFCGVCTGGGNAANMSDKPEGGRPPDSEPLVDCVKES